MSAENDHNCKPLSGDIRAHAQQAKGAKAYQEDAICVFWSDDETVVVAAVYDGHGGINGRVASTCCANLTREFFESSWKELLEWDDQMWVEQMNNFFGKMHESVREEFVKLEQARRVLSGQPCDDIVDHNGIVRKHTGFPVHGGTTGTIIVYINLPDRRRAICANVGDSDCLLLPSATAQTKTRQRYKHLSVDHGPDSPEEYFRIQNLHLDTSLIFVYDKQGVKKHECPKVFLPNAVKDPDYVKDPWGMGLRPTNVRYDPGVYAVTPVGVGEDTTCIAMTRSLGDLYAHQFGMTEEPSVTFEDLDLDQDYIITVGSDGIWDCWKFSDFADFLNGCVAKFEDDLPMAVEAILQHTIARAKACFGVKSFDDASLAVIQIKANQGIRNATQKQ